MNPKVISTIGLSCDIIGAILVAFEVVRVFRGTTTIDSGTAKKKRHPRIKSVFPFGTTPEHEVNPSFAEHEGRKRVIMGVGLCFLLVGFGLQIWAVWL